MPILYSAPDWFFRHLGARFIDASYATVERHLREVAGLSDDELQHDCRRALAGDDLRDRFGKPPRPSLTRRLSHLGRPDRIGLQPRYVALAVETFRRQPADLPPGSQLYPHQVRAAIALTQPCALQMDTGEGKTYAALAAAFTLACEFGHVYVVCANRYLAWRDARRTGPFWAAAGATVSYADLDSPTELWDRRIVYTTIRDLIFCDARNEIAAERPRHPIVPDAVLLDEIDAILLDGASQSYHTVRHLAEAPFEWSEAIRYAEQMAPEEITVDFADMTANLTVDGEVRLRERWALPAGASHRFLLVRYAVELSYVAVRIAQRDRDYVVRDGRVVEVDRRTGQLNVGSRPPWLLPLEATLHLQRGFRSVTLTRSDPARLLRRFRHVAGMSGSAAEDFLDYLFTYGLVPMTIPPRRPRQRGLKPDLTFRTRAEAHRAVAAHVHQAAGDRRPVLVGSQTIEDAESIHALLSGSPPAGSTLHLLTGKNEQGIAQVLEHAGEVGSVVVATQIAGRGVDIRLSAEARANGGLALVCAGHAVELRHDRQFLGRAGRQGDPYTAIFISSLEDDLMARFGSARVEQVMARLGMDEGEAIESPMIDKAVRRAQRQIRLHAFLARQTASMHARTLARAHEGVRAWFESLQSESDAYPDECGPEMIDWLASELINRHLLPICGRATLVSGPEAERVIETLAEELGLDRRALPVEPLDLEGHGKGVVRERLLAAIRRLVREAAAANHGVRDAARRAPTARGLIHELLNLRDALAGALPPAALTAAGPAANRALPAETAGAAPVVGTIEADPMTRLAAELGGAATARLIGTIDALARRLHDDASTRRDWAAVSLLHRTPRQIVAESLIAIWSQFLSDCDSHRFRISQAGLTTLAFYHRLDDEIDREWRRVHDLVAPKVLANLIAGAAPAALDDLFFTLEHQQSDTRPADEGFRPSEHVDVRPAAAPLPPARSAVQEFLAASPVSAGASATTAAEFRRAIVDFAERTPPARLQTPGRILDALAAWSRLETERGVSPDRRRVHLGWIRGYLRYLRQRQLIAPFPTVAERARWRLDQLLRSAVTEASLITLATLALFGLLFGAATAYGRIPGLELTGAWIAFDYLLCAGLLRAGAITSIAFPGLLAGRALLLVLMPRAARAPRGQPVERLLVLAVQVLLAVWVTPWPAEGATAVDISRAAAIFSGCLLVAVATNGLTWFIDHKAGVAMDALFLAIGLALAFGPWVAAAAGTPALALFVLAAALASVEPRLNRVSIRLATARIAVSGSALRSDEVLTTTAIPGRVGFPAYLFALLLAVSFGSLAGDGTWNRWAWFAVYAATLAGITLRVIGARTELAFWTTTLNATRRVVVGVEDLDGLRRFLRRQRWRLAGRGLTIEASLVGTGIALLGWDARLAALPAVPLVLLGANLLVDAARPSLTSMARLVLGLGRHHPPEIEIDDLTETDDDATVWQRLKKLKGGRLYSVLAFAVFVMQVVPLFLEPLSHESALELLKLLRDFVK